MKIAFVQPKSFFTWEALNVGYLAAMLKGHEVVFYSEFFDTREEILKGCFDADIIGFTCTSPQYKGAMELAKLLKRSDNTIVFGGFHPTNCPEVLDSVYVDAVVVGEGERAMLAVVDGLRGRVECEQIQDLDTIPFVDREVIKQERHNKWSKDTFGNVRMAMLMGRGCKYSCSFCSSHSVWGRKQRLRSPENIMAELTAIMKYGPDMIAFADDELGIDTNHLREFCLAKMDALNFVKWGCNVVAGTIDEDTALLMRASGCTEVWMGIESGNEQILRGMKKPYTKTIIHNAFDTFRDAGIKRRAYCLLGMPNETRETIRETEEFIDSVRPDTIGFTMLAPYPGSSFYNQSLSGVDWSGVDEYGNDFVRSKALSNEELKTEQKRLVAKYGEIKRCA